MTDTQALKDRIAQLEALLKVAMHRPNPDMGLHNRIRTCRGSYTFGTACGHCERCTWERNHPVPQFSKVEKLEARITQLEALLTESADDIEGEANMRWLTRHLSDREMRAYNRDMDLPNRIRAALKAGGVSDMR